MKSKILLIILLIAGIAGGAWFFTQRNGGKGAESKERKVAFYQSSMHPWIKSDRPGTCTICGMKLTPIYEGEKGFVTEGDIVTLGSNSIQVINVQTEPAKIRELERTLRVAGRIEADERRLRVLSAYVDGRVEKLFPNYVGAEVRAGEPLAVIYSPELLTAEREFLTALSQTNFPPDSRFTAEHQRLVEGAKQRLRRLGLTDADLERLQAGAATNFTTQIVAPISGTIISRSVAEGQYVKAGDKLFDIADLEKLWFRFEVYEQDLPAILPGQTVEVTSPALGTNRVAGTIAFIDPTINEAARSARVRVEIDNPLIGEGESARRALFNGLYAEGWIQVKLGQGLAVPRSAVLDPGDFPRVYVDNGGGAYELRKVKIGRRGAEYWEVVEGLDEDEPVVTNGNFLLDSQAQMNHATAAAASAHQHEHKEEAP